MKKRKNSSFFQKAKGGNHPKGGSNDVWTNGNVKRLRPMFCFKRNQLLMKNLPNFVIRFIHKNRISVGQNPGEVS